MRFDLPREVSRAIGMLEAAGFPAYAVGGCVRDRVLGMIPHDYDITTAASPEEMQRIFAKERTVGTGLKHGTLTVILDGMPIEITAFRVDGAYLDGRHPASVTYTRRVEEDLARRDFTINAMAYSPDRGLIDPFNGAEDCRAGIIRCVGDADKRFEEDSLRVLRALRFSARLGFSMEDGTARAIHAGKEGLRRISRERIAAELNGLLTGDHAGRVLAAYPDVLSVALDIPEDKADAAAWDRAFHALDTAPRDLCIRWAILLLPVAEHSGGILSSLRMPHQLTETVCTLTAWAGYDLTEDHLLYVLMHVGPERLEKLIDFRQAVQTARFSEATAREEAEKLRIALRRLLAQDACYTLKQLAVKGGDLAALGYRGQEIGEKLNELLLRVANGELPNEKESLLRAAAEEA